MTWREYRILKYIIETKDENNNCFVSFNKLVNNCRIGKKQAMDSTNLLISEKALILSKGIGTRSNCYTINLDKANEIISECIKNGDDKHIDRQPERYNTSW